MATESICASLRLWTALAWPGGRRPAAGLRSARCGAPARLSHRPERPPPSRPRAGHPAAVPPVLHIHLWQQPAPHRGALQGGPLLRQPAAHRHTLVVRRGTARPAPLPAPRQRRAGAAGSNDRRAIARLRAHRAPRAPPTSCRPHRWGPPPFAPPARAGAPSGMAPTPRHPRRPPPRYQRPGYVKAMAGLIEAELDQFPDPQEARRAPGGGAGGERLPQPAPGQIGALPRTAGLLNTAPFAPSSPPPPPRRACSSRPTACPSLTSSRRGTPTRRRWRAPFVYPLPLGAPFS
jgi:hypothetical protein